MASHGKGPNKGPGRKKTSEIGRVNPKDGWQSRIRAGVLSVRPKAGVGRKGGPHSSYGMLIRAEAAKAIAENKPADPAEIATRFNCSEQFARTTLAYWLGKLMKQPGHKGRRSRWYYITGGKPKAGK